MDKLLELINQNSEFTTAQLAAMLGENEADIIKRINTYKENKAIINWDKVPDSDVTAIIELKVTPKAETGFDDTLKIVASYDNVESVYLAASSSYDIIATARGKTIQEIAEFVSKRLSTLDTVIGTATNFVLTQYKDGGIIFNEDDESSEQRSLIL